MGSGTGRKNRENIEISYVFRNILLLSLSG